MRYTKTQSLYLSRKGVLPEIVDLFGMRSEDDIQRFEGGKEKTETEQEQESDDETTPDEVVPVVEEEDDGDDIDSFFG